MPEWNPEFPEPQPLAPGRRQREAWLQPKAAKERRAFWRQLRAQPAAAQQSWVRAERVSRPEAEQRQPALLGSQAVEVQGPQVEAALARPVVLARQPETAAAERRQPVFLGRPEGAARQLQAEAAQV